MWLDFLGDLSTRVLIIAAIVGIVLDVLTGLARAIMHNELSSEKMRMGLWHKCGFLGLIVLGIYMQWVEIVANISDYLGFAVPTCAGVCVYIIATECISIAENLKGINPEIGDSPIGGLTDKHEHNEDNDEE